MKKRITPFECRQCGCDRFDIIKEYVSGFAYTDYYECQCGRASRAAVREYIDKAFYQSAGPLREDHSFTLDETAKITDLPKESREFDIFCQDCYNQAEEEELKVEVHTLENEEEEVNFFVRCAGCGREIEFGWSEPGRGELIWPVESVDFLPQYLWPEPRYFDRWVQRGWFKPLTVKVNG